MGILERLRSGLTKTRTRFFGGLKSVLTLGRAIDEELLEELEESLLLSDVGPKTTGELIEAVREGASKGRLKTTDELRGFLQEEIAERLRIGGTGLARAEDGPTVVLVCGVNGSGKTTSIGKLTAYLRKQGDKVVLGACDTFRDRKSVV